MNDRLLRESVVSYWRQQYCGLKISARDCIAQFIATYHAAPRTAKKRFESYDIAINAIKAELINVRGRTQRTFWIGDQQYTARKTNVSIGVVNLSIKAGGTKQ